MADKGNKDDWLSNIGHDRLVSRQKDFREIYTNPGDYYAKREKKLNEIGTIAKKAYSERYDKLIAEKFGVIQSKEKANKYGKAIYDLLVEELDEEFPKDILQFDVNAASKKTFANLGGVIGKE